MKFTSKDLMNAMGLKVGDKFIVKDNDAFNEDAAVSYIWEVCQDDIFSGEIYCRSDSCSYQLFNFIEEEIAILPRYTLTNAEKEVLKNIPGEYESIYRCKESTWGKGGILLIGKLVGCGERFPFDHLFKFIEDGDEVLISELRKCL